MEREIVINERLTQPSMVTPTLFIGLGGCGLRIVRRVREHLSKRPDYAERYRALTKFAAFDTNINDLEQARQHMDEVFLLSDFEKEDYARLATGQAFLEPDDYFTQWVPEGYRFRAGDTAGAGQIRIESRLGLYYQTRHRDVVPRLRRLIEEMKDHSHGHRRLDSNELRIVLCYSVAGGTGSGSHLPLAYLIRDLASQLGKPRVYAVAVLSSVFEDKTGRNKDGIFANGYAALKETEHLMKLGAPESVTYPREGITFHYNPADQTRRTVHQQPFDFVYVIDRPERFAVDRVVDAAADGLYLQMFSRIFAEQAGDYDNYTQHQRFLVPHDFERKGVQGFTTFYGSYGSAVLLVPTDGLIDYCTRAAALDIMRTNFVSQIPPRPWFDNLRRDPEPFNTAEISIPGSGHREVSTRDFHELNTDDLKAARKDLYVRRIRLLARAEHLRRDTINRLEYLKIWRHGHGTAFTAPPTDPSLPGEIPELGAGPDDTTLSWRESIVGAIEASIGPWPTEPPEDASDAGLFTAARQRYLRNFKQQTDRLITGEAVLNTGEQGVAQQLRSVHERILSESIEWLSRSREPALPAFDQLKELEFLTRSDQAAGVDLRAQRYAFIMLQRHPIFAWASRRVRDGEPRAQAARPSFQETTQRRMMRSDAVNQEAVEQNVSELDRYAADLRAEASQHLEFAFARELHAFGERVDRYEQQLGEMEGGFDQVERDVERDLAKLREDGGAQANQYVLDGEALQMENGRRLWDYYYEDRHAGRSEFSIETPELNDLISRRFIDRTRRAGSVSHGARDLRSMLDSIAEYVRSIIEPEINGEHGHRDPARRDGYTLDVALEDEVRYRALHLSTQEQNGNGSRRDSIRRVLGEFKALPLEERRATVDLEDSVHRDYLRDKVRRIVDERAQLLCYYNGSLDQQGGVRPCNVFLGSISDDLRRTTIGAMITGSDIPGIQWLQDDAGGPRQIVFYRAVLNVPLYVFGRMKALQADYHQFRTMSRRPKVLHIDRNWEDSLQDLDPDAAIAFHRRQSLRRQVIGFAALFVASEVAESIPERIITQMSANGARDEAYWILRPDPNISGARATRAPAPGDDDTTQGRYQRLGSDLRDAIANLPDVLQNNPIQYQPYQAIINGVSRGIAPALLQRVCEQVIAWKEQHDSRRERYGVAPDDRQRRRLSDLQETWSRLAEALEDLHRELSESLEEHVAESDPSDGAHRTGPLTGQAERDAIRDSVRALETFRQRWEVIMNPETADGVPDVFQSLFGPVNSRSGQV